MKYRNLSIVALILVVLLAGWFFFVRDTGPRTVTNPPTAEELERIEEIEESSSQIDPNAETGVGVRPVGSLPPEPEPVTETATSTGTTTQATTTREIE